ncbi:MAG TPA: ABC transporter ATP-binding protein, partial [Candidatus Babeliales bacterium]|nr:ABC transporter ATP-binding protein [Candidatus Babeliales bacterium]
LLGVNGAGKTTLSSLIATLHPPTSGEIFFEGKSIYEDLYKYRFKIGFCPQHPNLDSALTVKENLVFAGRYYLIPNKELNERVEQLLVDLDLLRYADAKVETLSGGYRQRVLIARAIIHNPDIVIFDEPTVGLDPHIRRQIWDVVLNLKKQKKTIIFTTHYLDEAEVLSDRVCMLNKGKVLLIDESQNLKKKYDKSNLEEVFLHLMNLEE